MESDRKSSNLRPVRRPAVGERASSFGLELEERRALVARDRETLARFFDLAFPPVHAYIARMLRDEHLAEDLTQETFVRIQRGLATYRPDQPLRPWVFTIASNVLRDHFASKKGNALALDELEGDDDEPIAPHETPPASADREERARATVRALSELAEPIRAVLVLRHYHTLSFAEIADSLAIAEDAARQRYARALAKLRTRLAGFAPTTEEAS